MESGCAMRSTNQREPASAWRCVYGSIAAKGREKYSGQNATTIRGAETASMMLETFVIGISISSRTPGVTRRALNYIRPS
jgi:hypothetical protein